MLYLGVDGGGSHTVALVADSAGQIVGRGQAGPANPHSVGEQAAREALLQAIDAALAQAGARRSAVRAACLGLAGAGRASERALFHRWAQMERLAAHILVVIDCDLTLAAGTPAGRGLALIAGTGSIAWGRAPLPADPRAAAAPTVRGRPDAGAPPASHELPRAPTSSARAGGWGYLLGDDGSGFALGLEALRAIARADDGCGPPTALHQAILARWELATPQELIARVYRAPLPRAEIAALAPLVEQAAAGGDAVAQGIVAAAGAALARLLDAVARRLGLASGQPLPCALGGGLLVHGRLVRAQALQAATALGWRLEPIVHVAEPALGALRLARGEVPPPEGERVGARGSS